MKKILQIAGLLTIIFGTISCSKKDAEINFKDQQKFTLYSYIDANKEHFSSFLKIVEKGGLEDILSAYNPENDGYTLFLPTNEAIDKFILESGKYSSLEQLLNDTVYIEAMCRYHVVKKAFKTDDFPFGALSARTLSDDYLTISFIAENDTSYFKINNQAPVILPNIETSNGLIHIISNPLKPNIYTSYNWLEQNNGYSIFKDAVDATGLKDLLNLNTKLQLYPNPITLLVEHDSIFNKRKIYSLQDLKNVVSPANTNYTDPSNPLYNFVAYHILVGNNFLNNFEKNASNYSTFSDIPLAIEDYKKLYLAINKGKEILDTVINGSDTILIDYIGFNYDASNILTQSGVIHLIDDVMFQKTPSPKEQPYSFWEEPLLNSYRQLPGTYLIEDSTALYNIKYSGTDLKFVTGDTKYTSWPKSYLMLDGNFTITYKIPKIVQGKYKVYINAESLNSTNAIILLYIDGKNVGGQINLTTGGVNWDSFHRQDPITNEEQFLGEFNFTKYETHTIYIKSLIPGKFLWENIRFKP